MRRTQSGSHNFLRLNEMPFSLLLMFAFYASTTQYRQKKRSKDKKYMRALVLHYKVVQNDPKKVSFCLIESITKIWKNPQKITKIETFWVLLRWFFFRLFMINTALCITLFENYSKCRIWIFEFWAFSTNFCPIKSHLSGNTVWPQASIFQKLAKMHRFWHF